MNFLKRFFKRASIEDPSVPIDQALNYLTSGTQSYSGVRVTREVALGNPAVWRAVNLISSHVAKLPLHVFKRGENDSRERATQHPAYKLLKRESAETVSAYTFKQTLQAHALLNGNGYSWISRDSLGKPTELLILDPESTTPARENGRLLYVTQIGHQRFKISPSDCLHIKGLSFDGMVGYSVLDLLNDALGHGVALQRYGSTFFKNAAKPSVVIELPANIRDPEKLKSSAEYGGKYMRD